MFRLLVDGLYTDDLHPGLITEDLLQKKRNQILVLFETLNFCNDKVLAEKSPAYAIVFVDLMTIIGDSDDQGILASTLVQLIELWLFRASKDHRVLLNNVEVFMASLHVSTARLLSDKPGTLRSIELHLIAI